MFDFDHRIAELGELLATHAIKFYKEKNMSKKDTINITKDALNATYDKGCSDVKKVLRDLFPEHGFGKGIKLERGQIYKHSPQYLDEFCFAKDRRWLLVCNSGADEWNLFDLNSGGRWSRWMTEIDMGIKIKQKFTLCPNAKIQVVEND